MGVLLRSFTIGWQFSSLQGLEYPIYNFCRGKGQIRHVLMNAIGFLRNGGSIGAVKIAELIFSP